MKKALMPYFANFLVHPRTRKLSRFFHGLKDSRVHFFHDPLDPHSQLVLELAKNVRGLFFHMHEVSLDDLPPYMMDYKLKDARLLAKSYRLSLDESKLHRGSEEGNTLLKKLGHYQGAMFYYQGEWYWGVDRLGILCEHLNLSLPKPLWNKNELYRGDELHFYFSFRSPYSFLAFFEVEKLIDEFNLRVKFKPLFPMAMRGFKIPESKKMYIFKDAARIAHQRGLPFGKVCDPLGEGVVNVLKLFVLAEKKECERDFIRIIYEAIWAKGFELNSNNLIKLLNPLGFNKEEILEYLSREAPEKLMIHKEEMKEAGLWGVPSFKWGEFWTWGQDRIPLLREMIKART